MQVLLVLASTVLQHHVFPALTQWPMRTSHELGQDSWQGLCFGLLCFIEGFSVFWLGIISRAN